MSHSLEVIGGPDIDAFEAVMEGGGGRQRGFVVSFGYTKDAEQECAAFHNRTGRLIKLLTVQEILDEEHVKPMRSRARWAQRCAARARTIICKPL